MKDNLKYIYQNCRLLQQKVKKPECFPQHQEMGSMCKSQGVPDCWYVFIHTLHLLAQNAHMSRLVQLRLPPWFWHNACLNDKVQKTQTVHSPRVIIRMHFAFFPQVFLGNFLTVPSRILDILILQDKTLFCACVNNFKQNGGFWRHCACADNFKQNGVFLRQHLPVVRVWTWPKYNKHHHDLKKQLCRFIDMYIGKIFWPTAPCRGCPEKEIWGQG